MTHVIHIDATNASVAAISKPAFWGFATSAYQIEGAWNKDGRGPSIWDTFSQSGRCNGGATGNVAANHYEMWEQDVDLLADLKAKAYRFSISWSRILPNGRTTDVNEAGIAFYDNLINRLLSKGITPYITLYHWDLPQTLQDEYGGWISPRIVDDYVNYAKLCIDRFGDRVKNWFTFNEPQVFCRLGYDVGVHAPGLRLGNDVWKCGHHVLLAHAKTVQYFRNKFSGGSRIGLALDSIWGEPLNPNSQSDIRAAESFREGGLGWFADPIYLGDYPQGLKTRIGGAMPQFTDQEKALLKGSTDFFGLNFYTGYYVTGTPENPQPVYSRDGVAIGEQAQSSWLYVVPWSFRRILNYIADRYHIAKPTSNTQHPIIITENGVSPPNEQLVSTATPVGVTLDDSFRVRYYEGYLGEMGNAIAVDGVNVEGYFAW
ncbi:hypothetical protein HK102_003774 [Quaeritorhiza haematococci]|nr:hypothetical protein HK102_003774 [Quaeritorhiza haematococci]